MHLRHWAYFSFPLVEVTNRVYQSVWPEDDACALRPLRAHERVLTKQNLTNVFCARHPDNRLSQKMSFKNISMFLTPGDVKA